MVQIHQQKHIAIIITSLVGGGAEKVMLTLAQEMIAMGHRVVMFSLHNDTVYQIPKGLELEYPLANQPGKLRSWFNTKRLAKALEECIQQKQVNNKTFDLTLVNLHEAYRLASACHLPNPYYIIHNAYHQELKRELMMGPVKLFYMLSILKKLNSKHLLGVSRGVTNELKNARWFRPESVKCIYNPFSFEQIKRLSELRNEVSYKGKYILHVGRAAKAKRHDVLFEAMKLVNPSYKLICLSSNTRKLTKLAIKSGVKDRILFPGFTQNPYAWMKQASAVVLSSDFEGLPTVLIEALLCETPVVSTNCPHGPSEILEGSLSQYLAKVGDSVDLAKKINLVITADVSKLSIPILDKVHARAVAEEYLALAASD